MIIRFFGKNSESKGADDDGDAAKIEFINLVEPLVNIIQR